MESTCATWCRSCAGESLHSLHFPVSFAGYYSIGVSVTTAEEWQDSSWSFVLNSPTSSGLCTGDIRQYRVEGMCDGEGSILYYFIIPDELYAGTEISMTESRLVGGLLENSYFGIYNYSVGFSQAPFEQGSVWTNFVCSPDTALAESGSTHLRGAN